MCPDTVRHRRRGDRITGSFAALHMSPPGPTRTTWALQQVVRYLGYTGRAADVAARAAFDPERTSMPRFPQASVWPADAPMLPRRHRGPFPRFRCPRRRTCPCIAGCAAARSGGYRPDLANCTGPEPDSRGDVG